MLKVHYSVDAVFVSLCIVDFRERRAILLLMILIFAGFRFY